jgi:hypothetical protein
MRLDTTKIPNKFSHHYRSIVSPVSFVESRRETHMTLMDGNYAQDIRNIRHGISKRLHER